jgi:hypothetical protein
MSREMDDENVEDCSDDDSIESDDLGGADGKPKDKIPSRVWSYDIWNLRIEDDPTLGILEDQYKKSHEYQKELVRLEIERRKTYRALRAEYFPEICKLEAEIAPYEAEVKEIRQKYKKVRQKDRARTQFPPDAKLRLRELSGILKPLYEKKKTTIAAIDEDHRSLLLVHCPEILELDGKIAEAKAEKNSLKKKVNTPEVKARFIFLKGLIKELEINRMARILSLGINLRLFPYFMLESRADELNRDINKRGRDARIRIDPFWGNYVIVNGVVKLMRGSKIDPVDPDKKGWDGGGRAAIVFQPPIPVKRIFGDKNQNLQLAEIPEETYYHPKRCERRKGTRATGRIRVNSTAKGKPIWLSFDFNMHREIPKDAIVKIAWIKRSRVGWEYRYKLQITIAAEKYSSETFGQGTCSIDLGWRCRNGRPLRVAYLVDDQGHEEEILLDKAIQEKFDHVNALRSRRDIEFDKIREEVVKWLEGRSIKDWLSERWKHLSKWKNIRNFIKDVDSWIDERVADDGEIFPKVLDFYYQENHLYFWEANEREKALAARLDDWRNVSARISSRYEAVRMEDFDLSEVAKLAPPEADKDVPRKARHNRVQAAPSEFRLVLVSACQARGTLVETFPCAYTTMKCHVCGEENEWDKAAELVHTCTKCKSVWDQDQNAAINGLSAVKKGKEFELVENPSYATKEERVCEIGLYFDPSSAQKVGYVQEGCNRREIFITPAITRLLDLADKEHEERRKNFSEVKAGIEQVKDYFAKTPLYRLFEWGTQASAKRLCRAFEKWKASRVPSDGLIFERVRGWMTYETMARERERSFRIDAASLRREIYMKVAEGLKGCGRVTIIAIGACGIPRRLDTAPAQLRATIEEVLRRERIPYTTDRRRHYESARARLEAARSAVA